MNRGNGIRAFVTIGALGLALGAPLPVAEAQTLASLTEPRPRAAISSEEKRKRRIAAW